MTDSKVLPEMTSTTTPAALNMRLRCSSIKEDLSSRSTDLVKKKTPECSTPANAVNTRKYSTPEVFHGDPGPAAFDHNFSNSGINANISLIYFAFQTWVNFRSKTQTKTLEF